MKAAHIILEGTKGILTTLRDITIHKQVEEALRKKTHNLGERVKELNCLYAMSQLIEQPGISLDEILQFHWHVEPYLLASQIGCRIAKFLPERVPHRIYLIWPAIFGKG